MHGTGWIRWIALGALFAMGGCGESDGIKGATGTVTGKVTFKNAPVPSGCVVTFQGMTKASGSGTAIVVGDGKYTLRNGASDKISPGTYSVTIAPPPAPPIDQAVIDKYMQTNDPSLLPKQSAPPFPTKYLDPTASGIKVDVKEGKNELDIALTE